MLDPQVMLDEGEERGRADHLGPKRECTEEKTDQQPKARRSHFWKGSRRLPLGKALAL
jgi:hypothetical protein